MSPFILNLPDNFDHKTLDISVYVASKLYEDAILSAGHAAEMAGLSKRAFIEIMGKYGVSVFSSSTEDILNDVNNA